MYFMQFTGCAFGTAAIWQYESLKSRVQGYFDGIKADWLDSIRPQKEGDFRKEVKINMAFFVFLITILGLVTCEVFLVNGNIKSVDVK